MSENIDMENIIKELNSIRFRGVENTQVGDILYYPITVYGKQLNSLGSILKFIFLIIFRTMIRSNSLSHKGTGENLFYLSECDARKDQYNNFSNIVSIIDNSTKSAYKRWSGVHISFLRFLPLFFKWTKQCNVVFNNPLRAAGCVYYLYIAKIDYEEIKSYIKKHKLQIKRVTVCNDTAPTGSFIVQQFNNDEVTTFTLQHGVFSACCNSWLLRGSHSSYYLAANFFTLHEAERIPGVNMSKIIPAGMTYSIGNDNIPCPEIFSAEIIGVFPDGESLHEDNLSMIGFVRDYCIRTGRKLYVKLHPSSFDKLSLYKEVYTDNVEYICDEYSLNEMANIIDIAVVRNSTVMIQMLESWIPTFVCYSDGQAMDVYGDSTEMFRFSNIEELNALVDDLQSEGFKKKFGEYRSSFFIDNAKERYMSIYDEKQK